MDNTLKSICIVGGGTTGWMAASLLSSVLKGSDISITVVESPDIASIGVGESTVPSIMDFLSVCQINPKEFIEATSASFKLGIRFDDWLKPGHSYFHPFGKVGQEVNGYEFYQVWLKTLADGHSTRWVDHSPSAIMAENHRFMLGSAQYKMPLPQYNYALHLDAVLVARYLRELSQVRGVKRVEATVDQVVLDERQCIDSLKLNSGAVVTADFFIDCTGFKGLLIEEALKVGYESWDKYLPCDRAVAVQTKNSENLAPYTISTAREAGWTWKIPLQHRTGNGYVFSGQHCSDDKAVDALLSAVDGDVISDPKVIPFVTGRRKKVWHKNCLALGLASGFLEPLESTAIHLVYQSLIHFIRHFPDADFDICQEDQFNSKVNADYQEVRDFIILHYCTSDRDDTEFWQWCKTMPVPDSLHEKIELFRERGQLQGGKNDFFGSDSWYSILEGMNVRPKKYHPLMNAFNDKELAQLLEGSSQKMHDIVLRMPTHGDFIKKNCFSKPFS
ncbi:tryptophan halogenase family protein [uncultured Gilvimarinus sp.]|uniref:tryptophan halogenase family protein n=1 Tax=uncultured Gilvimarinus sp. TaxID=1689143 RepID=UPI0030EF88E2|tara:strand:- start:1703 stop:3211 length:1509 start_codon:yes stop_codon:yes gene_type:complete